MDVIKVNSRNILFRFQYPEWDLNIHLILGDQTTFLVDTGVGIECMQPVLDYLQAKGQTQPLTVINTHYHWDHMWGNHLFADRPIIAHRLCYDLANEAWDEMIMKNHAYVSGEVKKCLPNLLFEKELYFPAEGVRIFHAPGHSADCISILDEREGVLDVGDNIGDTLEMIVPELECEKDVYRQSLAKYQAMDFEICVSGHNQVLGKEVIGQVMQALVK